MFRKIGIGLGAIAMVACQQTAPSVKEGDPAKLGFDLADIDSSVTPCEDFFQYTSGNWIKNNPIPATESRWGSFNELIEANNKKVKNLLVEVAATEHPKGSYQQLIADLYKSGMDSVGVENAGYDGLQDLLGKVGAVKTHHDYLQLLGDFKRRGITHPWGVFVGTDDKNSSAYILQMSQSGLGMPDRDYYLKTDSISLSIQETYKAHIAKMLGLSSGMDEAAASAAAEGIYLFEAKLAEKAMSREERRSPERTYNKMQYSQVLALAPNLQLGRYFKSNAIQFDSAIVRQPDYIRAMDSIVMEESAEVIRNYAHWCVINEYAPYLSSDFVMADFDFYSKTLRGSKEIKPRWKRVLSSVENGLGEPLGHIFVDKYFPESSKEKIQGMVEDLRSAYKERILQLDWMGEETKKKALEKLAGFTYKIGYPDKWEKFEGLDIIPNNYLQNIMNLNSYLVADNLHKLQEEVDRSEWFMPAHIVNAYYNPANNEVVFPAGILQPPFYNPNAEAAINYGGIGGVIGHEFTHGFDDEGSKYNTEGNLADWWTAEDRGRFDGKTELLADQYSGYEPLLDVHVNGKLTLGENIADLGGLTLGYYAYKKSLENGRENVNISGFTWQQRIFLGWAQVWQTNQTDAYLRNQVTTDPHSPAKYRVNGPMSNMDEFREAWGCAEGDAMVNSGDKQVKIW